MMLRARPLLLCVLLASCSGGGAAATPPRATQAPVSTSSVTVTVKIIAPTQSARRAPRYVSPSTKSMKVLVGPTSSAPTATATVDCSPSACTTTIDAPNGPDTFTVNLYDATGGTGNLLSTGTTNFTIIAGQLNVVSLIFNGVPAALRISVSATAFARGLASTAQLTATEVDADGNIIIGPPAAYPSAITVATSDATGSVTLSPTQVTSSSQPPVTVTYNGSSAAPASVTFTATASGLPAASVSIPIGTGTLLYAGVNTLIDQLLVSNGVVQSKLGRFGTATGVGVYTTGVVVGPDGTIYESYLNSNTAWSRDRSQQQRTLPLGTVVATDGAGNIYVVTSTGFAVYPPNATQSTAPLRVLNVVPGSATVDAQGFLYVEESSTRISVYAPNSSGAVAPVRSLLAPNGITFGGGLATDTSRNLYAEGALFNQPAILIYAPAAQGAVAPNRTISGPNTTLGLGEPIAVDASGYVYTWGIFGLISFGPTASGDVAPLSTYAESAGRDARQDGLAVDPSAITSAGAPQGAGSAPVVTFRSSALANTTTVGPSHLAPGPDGNVWFTYDAQNAIGKVTPAGAVTTYSTPAGAARPERIAAGPDGAMWFVASSSNAIGRSTTGGAITAFPVAGTCCALDGITGGPDGNVWFTGTGFVGKITPGGVITQYPAPSGVQPHQITTGPDGNLWSNYDTGMVRITPSGVFTAFTAPVSQRVLMTIASGPDAKVWFTSTTGIAKIDPATGTVTAVPYDVCCPQFTFGTDTSVYTTTISKFSQVGQIFWDVLPPNDPSAYDMVTGGDGNIWFLQYYNNGSTFGASAVTVMVVH